MQSKFIQFCLVCCLFGAFQASAQYSVTLPDREVTVRVVNGAAVFSGAGVSGEPGQPLLPVYKLSFILPPGVDPKTVSISTAGIVEETVAGNYRIDPALPLMGPEGYEWPVGRNIRNGKDMDVYDKDAFFPADNIGKATFGKMREYQLVDVMVSPYRYNPRTGELKKLTGGTLTVSLPGGSPAVQLMQMKSSPSATGADGNAEKFLRRFTANPSVIEEYKASSSLLKSSAYAVSGVSAAATGPGYAIITTQAIVNGSTQLQNLINQKTAAGYNVIRVTESTWGGGTGDVAAERIRSWLMQNYLTQNIQYVLLIGNPNPATGDVPMKQLWPRYGASGDQDAPTDYYYTDLTAGNDWDINDNGKLGEENLDFGQPGGPDLYPDVCVGRIPYYGVMADLDKILAKSIAYAGETSRGWRKSVLLPMEPAFPDYPGCQIGEAIKTGYIDPYGWRSVRIYDKYSTYDQRYVDAVLNLNPAVEKANCTPENVQDVWTKNKFGMVIWFTHGSPTSASDIFSSSQAASLNDKFPAMTFQISCDNGTPEVTDNLGYALLRNGAVTTISGSRDTYCGNPELNHNSNAGMGYSWGYYSVNFRMTAGDALNVVRTTQNNPSWANIIIFNLYGLPDLSLNFDSDVPENLSACATSATQVELTWSSNVSDATGYRIERAIGNGSFAEIGIAAGNAISYYDNGVAANTKYRYRVRMYSPSTTTDYSEIDSTTTFGNIAPGKTITYSSQQTGNLASAAIDGNTATRWAASSGTMPQWYKVDLGASRPISGCEIMFERTGTSGDCNDFVVETSTDNAVWTAQVSRNPNTNTAQTQTYSFNATARYVRITISDAPGSYYASMYEFRVLGETVPAQPVWNTPGAVPEDQFRLSWQPSSGAASYTLYQRGIGGSRFIIADNITATSFTTTSLLGGKYYIFQVAANNAAGHSLNTIGGNDYWVSAPVTPPVACGYLLVDPIRYIPGYALRWNCTSKNVTGFEIQRTVAGTSNWTTIYPAQYYETSFTDAYAQAGVSFEYRIRAYNDGGYSPYVVANTNIPPLAPDDAFASFDGANVSLSWTFNGATQTGFTIQRMGNTTSWQTIATLGTGVRSYVDPNLPVNYTYSYQVCAFNAWGENCTSAPEYIYTQPAAPSNLTTSVGATVTTAVLNWTNNSHTSELNLIERALGNAAFEEVARPKGGMTTYTDQNLIAGATYRYRVRAWNPSYTSDPSNVATIIMTQPVPLPPINLTATANSRAQITLAWVDSSINETGFYIERAPSGGSFTQIASVGANVSTYVNNSGLSAGTTYQYRVRAYNGNGNSAYSNTASTATHGNLSLSGTPTASSVQTGNAVANAKDNSTTTRWCASSSTMPQWWKVDFGSSKTLSEIEIMFEKAGTSGDCNDFIVATSTDNTNWTTRVDKATNTTTAQTQAYTFTATARYVRVTINDAPGTYWASMFECRVFGK
jgi:fibronectin type 3 domain-containing protein